MSVVMALYNDGPYLLRSIGSILAQTFTDFELIVVDDGSTDETATLLASFDDPRLVVVRQDNRGVAHALNRAAGMAQGEYIARIDGDDRSSPDRLDLQVAFLDARPDHVLVGSWWRVRDLDGRVLGEHTTPSSDRGLRWRALFDLPFPHSAFLMRRDAFERIGGYDPDFAFAQDYDLVRRLTKVGKVGAVPEILTDWQFDHREGRSVRHHKEQRSFVIDVSMAGLTELFSGPAISPEEVDSLLRVIGQPWAVSRGQAAEAPAVFHRVRQAFLQVHPGSRAAVKEAFRGYARGLLVARAGSRRVLISRMIAAFRLAPSMTVSKPGLRTAARVLLNRLDGLAP